MLARFRETVRFRILEVSPDLGADLAEALAEGYLFLFLMILLLMLGFAAPGILIAIKDAVRRRRRKPATRLG
jgi:hypothetical protein